MLSALREGRNVYLFSSVNEFCHYIGWDCKKKKYFHPELAGLQSFDLIVSCPITNAREARGFHILACI